VKSILRRRPSPALVIACIALFLSLGGVSYGVATGFIDSREIKNNTIRSKDVRNNTLRTFDIRNNEVRGFDIRNSSIQGRDVAFDTLTGVDVSEESLEKVPSAATADSATTAASVSMIKTVPPTTMVEGGAVTLVTHGPLTVTAACEANGTATEAKLRVQTTETRSSAGGNMDTPTLEPAAGPVSVGEVSDDEATASREIQDTSLVASAPSGKSLSGVVGLQADASGTDTCTVHGHIVLEG
jgi:hypothetical protein